MFLELCLVQAGRHQLEEHFRTRAFWKRRLRSQGAFQALACLSSLLGTGWQLKAKKAEVKCVCRATCRRGFQAGWWNPRQRQGRCRLRRHLPAFRRAPESCLRSAALARFRRTRLDLIFNNASITQGALFGKAVRTEGRALPNVPKQVRLSSEFFTNYPLN